MATQPYDPSLIVDERGQQHRARGGLADRLVGMGIERDNNMRRREQWATGDMRRRGFAAPHADPGALRGAGWGGYSGIIRGLAHGAEAQGRDFEIDLDTWGNTKDFDVPTGRTYSRDAGMVAPGMRGRPSRAIARLTGANEQKGGYYTPDEFEHARMGLARAFRGL